VPDFLPKRADLARAHRSIAVRIFVAATSVAWASAARRTRAPGAAPQRHGDLKVAATPLEFKKRLRGHATIWYSADARCSN